MDNSHASERKIESRQILYRARSTSNRFTFNDQAAKKKNKRKKQKLKCGKLTLTWPHPDYDDINAAEFWWSHFKIESGAAACHAKT